MTYFIVFLGGSGEIVRSGSTPNEATSLAQAGVGESVMFGKAIDTVNYILDGKIVDRPVIEVAATATVGIPIIVAGVPSGVDILVDGATVGTSDGADIELVFDLDGEYEVTFALPFPFVRGNHKVVVT